MTEWDAPNQQVVRPDASGPWEEGEGGTSIEPEAGGGRSRDAGPQTDELDEMTKDELLDEADERGVKVNAAMNKDEIKAAIRAG